MFKQRYKMGAASLIMAITLATLSHMAHAEPYSPQSDIIPPDAVTVQDEKAAEVLRKAYEANQKLGTICRVSGPTNNMAAIIANSKKCMCSHFDIFIQPFRYRREAVADLLNRKPELKGKPFVVTGAGIPPHYVKAEDQSVESDDDLKRGFDCSK